MVPAWGQCPERLWCRSVDVIDALNQEKIYTVVTFMSDDTHSEKQIYSQNVDFFFLQLDFWGIGILMPKEGLLLTLNTTIIPQNWNKTALQEDFLRKSTLRWLVCRVIRVLLRSADRKRWKQDLAEDEVKLYCGLRKLQPTLWVTKMGWSFITVLGWVRGTGLSTPESISHWMWAALREGVQLMRWFSSAEQSPKRHDSRGLCASSPLSSWSLRSFSPEGELGDQGGASKSPAQTVCSPVAHTTGKIVKDMILDRMRTNSTKLAKNGYFTNGQGRRIDGAEEGLRPFLVLPCPMVKASGRLLVTQDGGGQPGSGSLQSKSLCH